MLGHSSVQVTRHYLDSFDLKKPMKSMTVCSKIDKLGLWGYVNHSVPHVHPVKVIVYKMDRNHSNRFCKFLAANKTLRYEKTYPIYISLTLCINP